jgi:predicted nucleotidyltransferase component of viral defense system
MINKTVAKKELFDLYYSIKNESMFQDYILGGGTALALQLGHRTSTDIDLFTANKKNNKDILNKLNEQYGTYFIVNITEPVLEVTIKNIKVDFITDKNNIIETPKTDEKITYFGKNDISAMKLRAILTRTKARDYIDIAYLLTTIPLNNMLDNYRKKYNQDDTAIIKIALLKCGNIPKNEWNENIHMLKNDFPPENIPDIIEKEIKKHNNKYNIGNKKNIFKTIKENIIKTVRK